MKNRMQPGVLVAAAAIATLAGGWYFEARQRQHDAGVFEARLARLEQAQTPYAASPAPPARARGGVSAEALAGILPAAPERGPRVQTAADLQREQSQGLARLESRFATDGSDPAWAMTTEADVAQAAADPALAAFKAPQASDVRCARTMCRLVFTFASLDQAEDWLTYYPLGVTRQLPVFRNQSVVLPDGRVQLSMFGFRDAHSVGL